MAAGTPGPTVANQGVRGLHANPGMGALMAPDAGDGASTASGTSAGEDAVSGLQFAYGTVAQGDPALTISHAFDEVEKLVFVEIVGVVSSVRYRMKVDGDATRLPTTISATFLLHQNVEWEGILDVTKSPIRTLAGIPGWQLDAFKEEARGASFFDPLADVVTEAFGSSGADEFGAGIIAKKSGAGVAGRAGIACVFGALASGLTGPLAPLAMTAGCLMGGRPLYVS